MHAVRKHDKLAFSRTLGNCLATSGTLLASTELHTPTKIESVPMLEKPHMAYVAMVAERS